MKGTDTFTENYKGTTTNTTTALHTSSPEEESSNLPPAVLTQSDIPSLIDALVSRFYQALRLAARLADQVTYSYVCVIFS